MKARGIAIGMAALIFPALPATAADWTHAVTPYLWAAGMNGTTAIGTSRGPLEADLDLSFGDVLENLKMGGMLSYRGQTGPYNVFFDGIFMNLGARDELPGPLGGAAIVGMKQLMLEADLGYRLKDWLTVLAGLRYNGLDSRVEIDLQGNSHVGKADASWLDPVVGAMVEHEFSGKWSLALRGDIGGFGVGSDFAWQLMAIVRWHITDELDLSAGYRYIDVDYERNDDHGIVKYDVASTGPGIGLTWKF